MLKKTLKIHLHTLQSIGLIKIMTTQKFLCDFFHFVVVIFSESKQFSFSRRLLTSQIKLMNNDQTLTFPLSLKLTSRNITYY